MKKLVVLTGAGMSAESGISTFRDNNGLWNNHRVEEVATPEAWAANPDLVNEFYNQRRRQLYSVEPNAGHYQLAELQNDFDVQIITQNVDDLHERAGSQNVLHLHGELKKVQSTIDSHYIVQLNGWELKIGDLCPKGGQLRPHIVWFGEEVPMIDKAIEITSHADLFAVIGTSLAVYPAAGLLHYIPERAPLYYVDPRATSLPGFSSLHVIADKAGTGVATLAQMIR